MIVNLTCRYDEKQPTGDYANRSASCAVEISSLESPDQQAILNKAKELFSTVKQAVLDELGGDVKAAEPQPKPSNGNGSNGDGHAAAPSRPSNGNGSGNGRRAYGRPAVPPSDKQKGLLATLVRQKRLPPETVREICERVAGCRLEQLDRKGFSRLLENLMSEAVAK